MPVSPREHSSESPAVEVSGEQSRAGEQRNHRNSGSGHNINAAVPATGAQQRISGCRGICSRKLKGSELQNKAAGLSSKEEKGFFCGDRPLATAGSVARSAQVFKLQKALRKYLSVVRTFLLEMFKLQSQTAGV